MPLIAPLPYLELNRLPSRAAPWTGETAGEGWQWGDFYVAFEERPTVVATSLLRIMGQPPRPSTLIYHYAANVFYRPECGPQPPSIRPVLSAGIEQLNPAGVTAELRQMSGQTDLSALPLMIGIFTSGIHANHGHFEGPVNIDTCRAALFDVLSQYLKEPTTPQRIGTALDVRAIIRPDLSVAPTSHHRWWRFALGAIVILGLIGLLRHFL
jgi:hypothetical protein